MGVVLVATVYHMHACNAGTVMAVCVECGRQSNQQLFKRYTGGAIQLVQCVSC